MTAHRRRDADRDSVERAVESRFALQTLFSCEGRVALVTGGATGIGAACAEALGAAGAAVGIIGLQGGTGSETPVSPGAAAQRLRTSGIRAFGVDADVTDSDQLADAVACMERELGPIDTVVAVAGSSLDGVRDDRLVDLDQMYALNVRSVVELSDLVLPGMARSGGGAFIVMSSLAGLRGNTELADYGVTKAANAQVARNIAVKWGSAGIRANAVSPGVIETEFSRPITEDPDRSVIRRGKTPLGRFGIPAEVAGAVVWLASPSGAFTSGQNIVIDGGTLVND